MNICNKNKNGFTLAEIIITFAIIGIIAALLIPTLIVSTNKQTYTSGFLKANQLLKQSSGTLMSNNSGTMAYLQADDESNELRDRYCSSLICIKKCDAGSGANSCYSSGIQNLINANFSDYTNLNTNYSWAVLANGMAMGFHYANSNCSGTLYTSTLGANVSCGQIAVDVNGLKTPNIVGRDIFYFVIHNQGIIPEGAQRTIYSDWTTFCNNSSVNALNGEGCAGRILTESKMNY